MKKIMLFTAVVFLSHIVLAEGLLTNTNQSAQYIRMLSRNASTDIDAVYFNPAGLIVLQDGWHFAFHNQFVFQNNIIKSEFPYLNDGNYEGKIQNPFFPTAFAVYKMKDLAFSFGFGPNCGSGFAEFERGLPSFEIPISKLIPTLVPLAQIDNSYEVTGYSTDLTASGSSFFWGIQLGATYKANDKFSIYGGVRILPAKTKYSASIENVQLKVSGNSISASEWLTNTSTSINQLAVQYSGAATSYSGAATSVQQLITAGAGSYTLIQAQTAGYITSAQYANYEGALSNIGLTSSQIAALNMNQVKTYFSNTAASYYAEANQLSATATSLTAQAAQQGDKHLDTEQTGIGFTPIIGVNISPMENLTIAARYEMKTRLELTNNTIADDMELFPNREIVNSDIPAILAIGIGYSLPSGLVEAQLSLNMYFDKGVEDWGNNFRDVATLDPADIRKKVVKGNGYDVALGLQFNLSEDFSLSIGGLSSKSYVASSYQSDFSYVNPSWTAGAGITYKIKDYLTLDAGLSNIFYKDVVISYIDPDVSYYTDKLGKTKLSFAIGLTYSIF